AGLTKHEKLIKGLIEGPYKKQALVPASPWLDDKAPAAPVVKTDLQQGQLKISWNHADVKDVFRWVVYYQYGNTWSYVVLNRQDRFLVKPVLEGGVKLNKVVVSAVDRTGNESE